MTTAPLRRPVSDGDDGGDRDSPGDPDFDPAALAAALRERFGGGAGEARTVARQATDLAADGRVAADRGTPLTAAVVLRNLADAPEGGPATRWNWWLGALAVAHGDGYRAFQVVRYPDEG